MILKELYENVTHVQACSQDEFMSHVDTTVRALLARYDKEYVLLPKEVWIKHININDDLPVREEYFVAIRDNVLFLLTGNGDRKTDFVNEAEDAFKTVWKHKMRGKKFRSADYYSYDW